MNLIITDKNGINYTLAEETAKHLNLEVINIAVNELSKSIINKEGSITHGDREINPADVKSVTIIY